MLRQKKCTLKATALWCLAAGAGLLYGQTPPWSHFSLAGGPNTNVSSYVYDAVSNRMIVFGGSVNCVGSVNDTWVIINANGLTGAPEWQQLSPGGTLPAARNSQTAVYDQAHNRMIVFGGGQDPPCGGPYTTMFNDTWVLSHANGASGQPVWSQLSPATPQGLPAGRTGHSAVYDPGTNSMTIFGGCNDGIMSVPNDVWVLTNAMAWGASRRGPSLRPPATCRQPDVPK